AGPPTSGTDEGHAGAQTLPLTCGRDRCRSFLLIPASGDAFASSWVGEAPAEPNVRLGRSLAHPRNGTPPTGACMRERSLPSGDSHPRGRPRPNDVRVIR